MQFLKRSGIYLKHTIFTTSIELLNNIQFDISLASRNLIHTYQLQRLLHLSIINSTSILTYPFYG